MSALDPPRIGPNAARPPGDRQHLRVVDDDAGVEVLLCCASEDGDALRGMIPRLELPAVVARVLAGIELDADRLRAAVTSSATPTLFVVCRTLALDAAKSRRAVECFGGRRPLGHRLLVVEFDARRPVSWMTAIRRALESMRDARRISGARVEGMIDSGDQNTVRGETRVDRSIPSVARDDAPRVLWRDEVGPIPAHVRAPGARRRLEVVDAETTMTEGAASISDAVLVREESVAPAAARSESAPSPVARPPSRVGRSIAIAVVCATVLGFALGPLLGDASSDPDVAATTTSAEAISETHEVPALEPVVVPAPPPQPSLSAARAPVPATVPADETTIERAVEEGRLGRLEGLVVLRGPDRPLDWYAAANSCRARSVDGAGGFRLPSIDELRWLRRRGLVSLDRDLWSGTRVFGRNRQDWTLTSRGGLAALDKQDGLAYVVCVRGH